MSSLEERLLRLEARVTELEAENAALRQAVAARDARIEALLTELGRNSSNSGKPPSSDPPGMRDKRPGRQPSAKSAGGQPGHKGHRRELLPATRSTDRFPTRCSGCKGGLPKLSHGEPLIHQVVEIPRIVADVSQWVLHAVQCPNCSCVTRAKLPRGVPRGMVGPHLMALITLFIAGYKMSRRQVQEMLADVLGITLSLGTISNTEARVADLLETAYGEAAEAVNAADAKNLDATSWRQSGAQRTLWVYASRLATVFSIVADGTTESLRTLVSSLTGILMTDRGKQFTFWAMEKRQICWAHLLRKFAEFQQHSDQAVSNLGDGLVLITQGMLHHWHRVRDGTMTREEFSRVVVPQAELHIHRMLDELVALQRRGVSGACEDILKHQEALFTFAKVAGVEPTNNHAERELRDFVLWRKTSLGSQSDRGDRFAERAMTVLATLKKHERQPLAFLEDTIVAALHRRPSPKLLPATP
ncbi:MAG: IS66 family transposase [Deltaproteobacteria bacterium]